MQWAAQRAKMFLWLQKYGFHRNVQTVEIIIKKPGGKTVFSLCAVGTGSHRVGGDGNHTGGRIKQGRPGSPSAALLCIKQPLPVTSGH